MTFWDRGGVRIVLADVLKLPSNHTHTHMNIDEAVFILNSYIFILKSVTFVVFKPQLRHLFVDATIILTDERRLDSFYPSGRGVSFHSSTNI